MNAHRASGVSWSADDALGVVADAPDSIYACDRRGRLLAANPAFLNAIGRDGSDAVHQDVFAWIRADAREDVRGAIESQIADGIASTYAEFPLIGTSGRVVWVGQHTQIVSRNGIVVGWHAVGHDITAAREAELERLRLEAHVQYARHLEALGQLSGGVAHNFNNLLTAVIGFAEDLLVDPARPEADRQALMQIQRAGQRAAGIIRQLLAFGRGRSRTSEFADIAQVLASVQYRLGTLLRDDISLECDPPAERLVVQAETTLIEHVVVSLILNAQDALPTGGTIRLEAARVEDAPDSGLLWKGAAPHALVRMRVIDNGGGLSPEAQRHVFEPFFGTTRWDAGAGLGLAAVYGIVRSLGGTVTVDSDPSHGTTCSVYLRPVPAEDSPRATGPRSVLVVDGDIAILELAARLLRNAKFEVHTAASGESALAILEAEGPRVGVMLADLKLPDTSIADLVAAARACQIDLACVVMSGYGSRAAATAVGLPVVPKPFELDELVRTIDDALRRTEEQERPEIPKKRRGTIRDRGGMQ